MFGNQADGTTGLNEFETKIKKGKVIGRVKRDFELSGMSTFSQYWSQYQSRWEGVFSLEKVTITQFEIEQEINK